jgi:hypothetical protein
MDLDKDGDYRDGKAPEDSEPDIDISPKIITERLSGCCEEFTDRIRVVNGHAYLPVKWVGCAICTLLFFLP